MDFVYRKAGICLRGQRKKKTALNAAHLVFARNPPKNTDLLNGDWTNSVTAKEQSVQFRDTSRRQLDRHKYHISLIHKSTSQMH